MTHLELSRSQLGRGAASWAGVILKERFGLFGRITPTQVSGRGIFESADTEPLL